MNKRRRQHPITILIELISLIKAFFFPIIIFVILRHSLSVGEKVLIMIGFIVLSTLFNLIKWFYFTYEFNESEITIYHGIVNKQQIHIPFERIQTLTREQPIYLQPFELVNLQIDTSGQGKPDAVLKAITVKQVTKIEQQRRLMQTKATDLTQSRNAEASEPSLTKKAQQHSARYQIKFRDLFIYSLTSLSGFGIAGAMFAAWTQFDDLLPNRFKTIVNQFLSQSSFVLLGVLGLFALIIATMIVMFKIINRYYQFVLVRDGHQLTIARGLLSKHTMQLRTSRIQAICVAQTLLRRLFRLQTVTAYLAANKKEDSEDESQTVIVPVIKTNRSQQMLQQLLPNFKFDIPMQTDSRIKAALWLRLRFIYGILLAIVLSGVMVLAVLSHQWQWHVFQQTEVLSFIIVMIMGLCILLLSQTLLWSHDQSIAIKDDMLMLQTNRLFTKRTYYIKRDRIQGMQTRAWYGLLKRRQGAHMTIVIRDSDAFQLIKVYYIQTAIVEDIKTWLLTDK